ncbi:MAG: hypothetical protein HOV80_33425 [Polyangiaceae bacterium]|nr:hypothetical protein [Polyangiaceae bacterium]
MRKGLSLLALAIIAGCTASAGSVAELKERLEECELEADIPDDITEETASCAIDCMGDGCGDLEDETEFGESHAGDCMKHECDLDLFPDKPEITFGDDDGTLSTSAEELFAKPAGNPNPNTLVGIYEVTGSGYESIGGYFLDNDWRARTEIREDGIAMAIECRFEVSVGASDVRTNTAFAWSPIEVHDWGIRILESATDDAPYTTYGFDAHCSVELSGDDWPFCLEEEGVPEDYTACVTVRDGELKMVSRKESVEQAASKGEKIAD